MRSFIFSFLVLFLVLHGSVSMQAQIFQDDFSKKDKGINDPPFGNEKIGPPPPPDDASDAGGGPVGGNTPVGEGWLLLVALGAGYGSVKLVKARRDKNQMS